MDKWIPVVSAFLGTILGYLLNIIRDTFNRRFNIKIYFRDGLVDRSNSNVISFYAYFNIINKGHHMESVENVSIRLSSTTTDPDNPGKSIHEEYSMPKIEVGMDKKDATNSVFSVPPDQAITVKLEVYLEKDENTQLLFLEPEDKLPYSATACFKFTNRNKDIECEIPMLGIIPFI